MTTNPIMAAWQASTDAVRVDFIAHHPDHLRRLLGELDRQGARGVGVECPVCVSGRPRASCFGGRSTTRQAEAVDEINELVMRRAG